MTKAPRPLSRLWRGFARGAGLALCLWPASQALAQETSRKVILEASYDAPTTRYAHGVLGDDVEWGALRLRVDFCAGCARADVRQIVITLPQTRVFEDIAPRLADMDGDGAPEVIVVESDHKLGARLAIYTHDGLDTATPFIGRSNRWLAPIGAVDLDGDGAIEVAYIDRPHLAKTLRVWRYEAGALSQIASAEGFTNHQIGWDYIAGGIRDCGQGREMIVASGNWSQVVSVQLAPDLHATALGPYTAQAMSRAMSCTD